MLENIILKNLYFISSFAFNNFHICNSIYLFIFLTYYLVFVFFDFFRVSNFLNKFTFSFTSVFSLFFIINIYLLILYFFTLDAGLYSNINNNIDFTTSLIDNYLLFISLLIIFYFNTIFLLFYCFYLLIKFTFFLTLYIKDLSVDYIDESTIVLTHLFLFFLSILMLNIIF